MKRVCSVVLILLFLFQQTYVLRSLYAMKATIVLQQEQDIAMTKVIEKQAQVLTLSTAKVVDLDQQVNPIVEEDKEAGSDPVPELKELPK